MTQEAIKQGEGGCHWFYRECNRCGVYKPCSTQGCWPAADRNYYGQLCKACREHLVAQFESQVGDKPACPCQVGDNQKKEEAVHHGPA